MKNFDYESQTWGSGTVDLRAKDLAGLRLVYLVDHLKKHNFDWDNKNILEVGCGQGRYIKSIKKLFPKSNCYGQDVSHNAIRKAHINNDDGVIFFKSEKDLPFLNDTFDLVVVFDVLEHVNDQLGFLNEIKRVSKPKAFFHLNLPCEKDFASLWKYLKIMKLGGDLKKNYAGHINDHTRRSASQLLSHFGFQQIDNDYSFHFLGQVLDIAMFVFMYFNDKFLGKTVNSNDLVTKAENQKFSLSKSLESVAYFESKALRKIPGMSIHATYKNAI